MPRSEGPNKYGMIAMRATQLACRDRISPVVAWRIAAEEIYPEHPDSQRKPCPKSAFLGLAEEGLLEGVPRGSYTTSVDNKRYALEGLRLLLEDERLASDPKELWRRLMNGDTKRYNQQMHVVAALWLGKKIVRQ